MAINNYINLQKNDFFSPYLDGFANLKKSMSPNSTSQIYHLNQTITLVPFSTVDRVCHFVAGIALLIPVINLVASCALRYFASLTPSVVPQRYPGNVSSSPVEKGFSGSAAPLPPCSNDPERRNSIPRSSHSADPLESGDNGIGLQGASAAALPQDGLFSSEAPALPNHEQLSADTPSEPLSPSALQSVASRRARGIPYCDVLPVIRESVGEHDADSDTGETYSSGAGVVPCRLHLSEVEILIGKNRRGGNWSYFGGESTGKESSIYTAASKCEAVTRGFLGRTEEILSELSEEMRIGDEYKTYFMPITDRKITPEKFLQNRFLDVKTQVAWVRLTDLINAAKHPDRRLKIQGSQATLHPSFKATLADPRSQAVLDKIAMPSFFTQRFRRVA